MSSKVTSPAVPPYSSTTMAMCILFLRISCSATQQLMVSGTK
eukprot:CAMPEP_0173180992 /NCGR_PEP_ID=MMETSP1141-20130122/7034_1 /TAXON_ID=483371 /ORGANISM="non described non described, Strain CCMP2298" /LENGTH=41 /DNA_ID= /DNA_START= /DNA_END= /DNA_ORIENTATION=